MINDNEIKQKLIDEKYEELTLEERKNLYAEFSKENDCSDLKKSLENILFYKKPPTIQEVLDPKNKWLPKSITDSVFPHIKDNLIEELDPKNIKNLIVKYGSTRQGKTFNSIIIIFYIIIYLHHIREPAMYYGLSPLTRLCIYMLSYKFDKTIELYIAPLMEIMDQSERFHRIKFKDKVKETQREMGRDVIVWSSAATAGVITLASGLQIQLGNKNPNSIIGASVLACFISELAYFIEEAGASEDKIYEIYTNAVTRIKNTVGQQYLAFVYLDTSANNAESIIEEHIIKELQFKERTYFSWKSLWQARPELFPIWQKTGETFKIITGNGNIPASIVTDDRQLKDVPKDIIIDVPIDAYDSFKINLVKNIKDVAGFPTMSENKFIQNVEIINNMFNNKTLDNIEGGLVIDASLQPENQIWEKVRDTFFFKNVYGKYTIKRAPTEKRYIGIDLSHSTKGDAGGFCLLHKEFSMKKDLVVYVIDFCFAMLPGEKGISLDAPFYFARDLYHEGSVAIQGLYTDSFQSKSGQQFLERVHIPAIQQSIENILSPHQYFKTCLLTEQIKSGRNIFLKNNLQALITTRNTTRNTKEKVDHRLGSTNNKYFGDYDNSTCGINANDVSDSVTQALLGAFNDSEYLPSVIYENENKRFSKDKNSVEEQVNKLLMKI